MMDEIIRIKIMREELYKRLGCVDEKIINSITTRGRIYWAIRNGLNNVTDDILGQLDRDGAIRTIGFIEYLGEATKKTLGV